MLMGVLAGSINFQQERAMDCLPRLAISYKYFTRVHQALELDIAPVYSTLNDVECIEAMKKLLTLEQDVVTVEATLAKVEKTSYPLKRLYISFVCTHSYMSSRDGSL